MAGEHHSPRLLLRPGVPVLQRDASTLQAGLEAASRALLPDSPAVRAMLEALRDGYGRARPATHAPEHPAWARLVAADLLVPAGAAPGPAARTPVLVVGAGPLAGAVARLLRSTATEVEVEVRPGAEPGPGRGLVVLAVDGEVRRRDVDAWVGAGVPHLLVWTRAGVPRVGPLVVPGVTACLRCLDAHDAEDDPRWPLLLEQAADQPAAPADPVLAALAVAWAARDVRTLARGGRPSTWSAVVGVDGDGAPSRRSLRRHPCCGCAWDLDLLVG